MGDKDIEAQLNYLCRDKYYHAMQVVATDAISKYHNDSVFQFYKAFALLLGGSVPESMRALELLESNDNVNLGVTLALIYAHKKSIIVDREAVRELESNLKEARRNASNSSFYYAALFLYHSEKYEKGREYVERALKNDSQFVEALTLKGWIELSSLSNESHVLDALHYFQSALDINKNCLDALFGIVVVDKMRQKYDTSIAVLNRLIVKHPQLVTPLIEKMKVQLAQRDWDQVMELSNRILNLDKNNMEALKMQTLHLLCRDGKFDQAGSLLDMLYAEMESNEPKNVPLFIATGQLFSKICGRNELVLNETYKFIKRAVQLAPNGVLPLTELGCQLMLQEKFIEAIEMFQSATKLDESSLNALTYLTYCQLIENSSVDLAQQQIELLYEIQGKKTPMLSFMTAILSRDNPEKALAALNETVNLHLESCKNLPYSDQYLKMIDPDFLILIVKEYLTYLPPQPGFSATKSTLIVTPSSGDVIKRCTTILKRIADDCPALTEAIYLLAKVQFFSGDSNSAVSALQKIIKDLDPSFVNAHLLLARILMNQGQYQRAALVLEMGVSYNFRVREHPIFHMVNGMIAKRLDKMDECIESLQLALDNVKSGRAGSKQSHPDITLMDKATLYLELADALLSNSREEEAQKIMDEANSIFEGTVERSRITIANAEFCVKNNNIEQAFTLLEKVKPGDPYYLQAHTKLANLYLHKRHDRNSFTRCFREVVENCPGPETFVLLGDAYMSVLELDLAIESYQQALRQNVHDPELAKKMGKALVSTFRFDEAIMYYKEAIKSPNNCNLKFDLANLYLKLEKFEEAEQLLAADFNPSDGGQPDDLVTLAAEVKRLMLLTEVKENAGKFSSALVVAKEARDIQHKIQRRAIMDQTGSVIEQKEILATICIRLGDICKEMRDNDQAIQHYKEALNASPGNSDILMTLAKLYLQTNQPEQCEQMCNSILLDNPENEGASIIMADLAFRKIDFETALHHFKQLLLKEPQNWTALARLIEVARRTGNLDEMVEYLKRAENDLVTSKEEAGLSYCAGLYEWYTGNLNSALRQFNKARTDSEWGQQSIYNMIEICLNPDDDFVNSGGDMFTEPYDNNLDSRQMAIEMAERLHKELKPRSNVNSNSLDDEILRIRMLNNFILLATKQKSNIDKALQDFTAIASQETYKDHVGPILGMSTAYLLLKQAQRARNHLKRVAKNSWFYEQAEYLERCWLLLADHYVQSNKFEIANDLLKRVLQHNKSCVKAYEYSAYIAEKDQNYKEAAHYYSKAWKLSGRSKPAVGYKLAYTYLKSRQYVDAIEISHQVLKEFPEYPKIKKDILEKAKNNLRT